MADRTISVKLSARVDAYVAAMERARMATTGFSAETQRNMATVGRGLQTAGKRATIGLTLPLVGAGVAATKLSLDFGRSMALIQGLVGVSAAEVDKMRDSVLGLAGETARSPQELADALYFITSSGFEGAAALDVLEASARASAAGLGNTATIADLVTSAVNAYGQDALSAASATDTLTEAVRLGKSEPDELAGAMGRVLPMASALGIEFNEVAAGFAALSLTGNDANEAATQLRGIMAGLLSPSKEARDAMASVGLSMDDVLASLRDRGLLPTLQMLVGAFGDNSTAAEKVFGNVRALSGVMTLLGSNGAQTQAIFDDMTDSTGATDAAFNAMAETSGFKLQQAMASLKVSLIAVGDILVPMLADVASGVQSVAEWFTNLDPNIQKAIVAFAGLVAAIGPMLFIGGTLIRNFVEMKAALSLLSGGLGTLGLGFIGLTAAVAAGVYVWNSMHQHEREVTKATQEAGAALGDATREVYNFAIESEGAVSVIGALARANEALSDTLTGNTDAGNALRQALGAMGLQAKDALGVVLTVNDTIKGTSGDELSAGYEALARQLNLTGAEGRAVFQVLNTGRDNNAGRAYFDGVAASVGLTGDQLATMKDRFLAVISAADMFDPSELADQFLAEAQFANEANVALVERATAMAAASGQTGDSVAIYENFLQLVSALSPAEQAAALGIVDMGDAASGTGDALGAAADGADDMTDAVIAVGDSIESAADKAKSFADALSDAMNQLVSPQKGIVEATEAVWEAGQKFNDGIEKTNRSIDVSTEKGRTNRDLIEGWADSVLEMTDAQIQHGDSVADVNEGYLYNRKQILDAAEAAGFNRDEVRRLLNEYGLMPDLISTVITTNADAVAKGEVTRLIQQLGGIPTSIYPQVSVAISQGAWDEALRLLNTIDNPRDVPITPYLTRSTFDVTVRVNGSSRNSTLLGYTAQASAAGRFVAGGSNLLTTAGEVGGSAGDEVILPLGNPSRMRELLGMSGVGERVAAAMAGSMTAARGYPELSAPAGGGGGSSLSIGEMHVGDRNDLAAARDEMESLLWKVSR